MKFCSMKKKMQIDLPFIKQQVKNIIQAFSKEDMPQLKRREILVCWSFPPQDWLKLNTDGASKGTNHAASCGGVLRDAVGRWLYGFAANLGSASAIEAEIWGIYYGLSLAWSQGFEKVLVSSNSRACYSDASAERRSI